MVALMEKPENLKDIYGEGLNSLLFFLTTCFIGEIKVR